MNWKNKNVLITGVGGFAGSYLAKELINQEANVYGLVRRRADGTVAKNIVDRGIAGQLTLIEGDLTDITSMTNAMEESEPDYIFHLAAQSFVERSFDNSQETQHINCIGTSNLLEAIRIKDSDAKTVFAGSSEEYGLVLSSQEHYEKAKKRLRYYFPRTRGNSRSANKRNQPTKANVPLCRVQGLR
jgi:GDP-D-mannose dehydratase